MRKFVAGLSLAIFLATAASTFAQEKTAYVDPKPESTYWGVDAVNTRVLITLTESGFVDVWGDIPGTAVSGGAQIDDRDFTQSKFSLKMDASTFTTRDAWWDKIMKNGDGSLEVDKYPSITFVSKKITQANGKLQMTGALTLHGVTRDVTLDLDPPSRILSWRGDRWRSYQGRTVISRKEFGVNWSEPEHFNIPLLSDQIRILMVVNLTNPPRQNADGKTPPAGPKPAGNAPSGK
jgi:polyisoprenoid-binding protein YceI